MTPNPTAPDQPTEIEALRLMATCPRFQRCGVPACPLDLLADKRVALAGDPTCRLPKAKRRELGAGTALPHGGLTLGELNAERRYAGLSEDAKARMAAGARAGLARLEAARKGMSTGETDSPSAPRPACTPGQTTVNPLLEARP